MNALDSGTSIVVDMFNENCYLKFVHICCRSTVSILEVVAIRNYIFQFPKQ